MLHYGFSSVYLLNNLFNSFFALLNCTHYGVFNVCVEFLLIWYMFLKMGVQSVALDWKLVLNTCCLKQWVKSIMILMVSWFNLIIYFLQILFSSWTSFPLFFHTFFFCKFSLCDLDEHQSVYQICFASSVESYPDLELLFLSFFFISTFVVFIYDKSWKNRDLRVLNFFLFLLFFFLLLCMSIIGSRSV